MTPKDPTTSTRLRTLLWASNAHSLLLGRYDPNQNATRDAHSRLVARGNVLSGLIWEAAAP